VNNSVKKASSTVLGRTRASAPYIRVREGEKRRGAGPSRGRNVPGSRHRIEVRSDGEIPAPAPVAVTSQWISGLLTEGGGKGDVQVGIEERSEVRKRGGRAPVRGGKKGIAVRGLRHSRIFPGHVELNRRRKKGEAYGVARLKSGGFRVCSPTRRVEGIRRERITLRLADVLSSPEGEQNLAVQTAAQGEVDTGSSGKSCALIAFSVPDLETHC